MEIGVIEDVDGCNLVGKVQLKISEVVGGLLGGGREVNAGVAAKDGIAIYWDIG